MIGNTTSGLASSIIRAQIMTSMGKEAILDGLEFDGETVLCRVCGDRASGFHYGVHACEGCKGFFRRSIQQKIQYRPCLKNQQCNIQRVNRNRCQYCRLKKCISVGMSRDAVRFGRVPKKEKARIIEQMQKKNLASQCSELNSVLANELDVVQAVVAAHHQTCDITQFRARQMRDVALHKQEYISCPANMACPLNNEIGMDTNANRNNISDFSESFTPAITSVVEFARRIPGFLLLNQEDQVTLLKAGTFEVLLVRLACLFDPHSNTMMFTGGKLFKRQPTTMVNSAGFLLDSMFDFAERFNKMCLTDDEIALFSAVVLLSPDRPGIRNVEQVEKVQNKLTEALQNIVSTNHKEDGTLFAKLLMKTTDLRTLNTLHSEKSIAGQRSNHERRERQNTDDSDMDFQDSLSTMSSRSSPTLSETSNMTMTSGYSGETDGGSIVIGQRLPLDASGHQVVLRTPYGTFFREDMSGFYGMMSDQPRRRCNTLDRDTLSRPRLHTIEEGNRRRYTLDRDYINKMANRLSDRLETRNTIRGDSLPPSMSNSATSSPIQEEGSNVYRVPSSACFAPITVPDGAAGHPVAMATRTSPLAGSEAILAAARTGSSPGSPNSRSRSGSFTQDEYSNARPRCYSFHLNSEGRAARMSLQRRMLVAEQGQERDSQISPDGNHYLSSEMRRGSVGAAYGLHSFKHTSVMDRPLSYMRGRTDLDKNVDVEAVPVMKHMMPDCSVYGIQLNANQHPSLWHPQATLTMEMAPPISVPVMQRSREDLARPMNSRSREWELANTVPKEVSQEVLHRDTGKNSVIGQSTCPEMTKKESSEAQMLNNPKTNLVKLERSGGDRGNMATTVTAHISHFQPVAAPATSMVATPEQKNGFQENNTAALNLANDHPGMETLSPAVRSKAPSPEAGFGSKTNSSRGSPVGEDSSTEIFGHKKFDRFRKDKVQAEPTSGIVTEDQAVGVKGKEKLGSMNIKEEKMEEDQSVDEDIGQKELKIDVSDVKVERKSPYVENLSPTVSNSSTPSPNCDRPKLSAREAHPNLLAHLMNGGTSVRQSTPRMPSTAAVTSVAAPPAGIPLGFPWAMPSHLAQATHPHLQAQLFRHPFLTSQSTGFPGLVTTSPATLPPSSSISVQAHNQQFTSTHNQYNSSANPSPPIKISSQPNGNSDYNKSTNTKEDVHAAAVSHLKDKILRKYDSMENLSKIGKDSPTPSGGTGPNTVPGGTGPWSKSSSPTVQAVLSSTMDLNRELATKLTLSSSSVTSDTMASTPPLSSSPSAASQQGLVCPFSSHGANTTSSVAMAMLSTSAATSQPEPSSRFTSHNVYRMLMSQDSPVGSFPVYHSMLSQQYPHLNSAGAPTNHTPTSQSLLANMHHFAEMFVRGQVAAIPDTTEKRLDLNSPLNLTSRMEEKHVHPGSASPSHSPQTHA